MIVLAARLLSSRPAIAGRGTARSAVGGARAETRCKSSTYCSTSCHTPPPPPYARSRELRAVPLPPFHGGGRVSSFSRRAFAPELCHATVTALSDSSPPDFDPVVHAEATRPNAGGSACASEASAWIAGSSPAMTKERTEERKRFGGETPTDARLFCRAFVHGRASSVRRTTVGVPPRFSSQGVFHHKGLSLRPGFLGRGGTRFACPLSGCYPPLPVPVQR